eukprot:gene9734-biopygen7679
MDHTVPRDQQQATSDAPPAPLHRPPSPERDRGNR